MSIRTLSIIVLAIAFASLHSAPSAAAKEEVEKVKDAINVLEEIMGIPEKSIPPALLKNSHGIAIIPGVIKGGFIVGGRRGKGILSVRNEEDKWSNPSFITLTGGSFGWQIGVQSIDIVLIFRNKKNVEDIMKGKFTLGADASVAAGPVGRQLEAGTDVTLKAEIYSYSRSRGIFAGLALEGAALKIDNDANADFYGMENIKPKDILTKKAIKAPTVVDELKKVLIKYAP